MNADQKQVIAQRLRLLRNPVEASRLADEIEQGIPQEISYPGSLLNLHVYRVDAVAALANNTTSQAYPVDFSTVGGGSNTVVGMCGSVASANDGDAATLEVAINVNGTEEFGTTGQGRAFIPYACMFPKTSPILWFAGKGAPVKAGDRWNVTFKNNASGNTILPSLVFYVRRWS